MDTLDSGGSIRLLSGDYGTGADRTAFASVFKGRFTGQPLFFVYTFFHLIGSIHGQALNAFEVA